MTLIFILAALFAIFIWRSRPSLECTYGVLFAFPVANYALGLAIGPSAATSITALILCVGICYWISSPSQGIVPRREELWTGAVALGSYLLFYRLSLLWPDFISIGERLRDYALLAATLRSPLTPTEPWMTDTPLNYYVYWYRFGSSIASLGAEEAWGVYHQLAAFAFSAFLSCIFRLLTAHLGFRPSLGLIAATIAACGSNFSGVQHFLTRDTNWWGPSRVIPGAINEFPVWSFLLGDIHPHYLNLCALPFLTCVTLLLVRRRWSPQALVLGAIIWGPLGGQWLYSANAWELPAWGMLALWIIAVLAADALISILTKRNQSFTEERNWLRSIRFSREAMVGIGLLLLLTLILWVSTRHLEQPTKFSLESVTGPIEKTNTLDLLKHWGVQLVLIVGATVLAERNVIMAIASLLILILGSIYSQEAVVPLAFLTLIFFLQRGSIHLAEAQSPEASNSRARRVLTTALPLAFFSLVIFPEFLFIDDAYGGDIERMNTIFKFYSAAWWMSWVGAFLLMAEAAKRIPVSVRIKAQVAFPQGLALSLALCLMLGFFLRTIALRKTERFSVFPISMGLSVIDQRFPGSAETIKRLQPLSKAIVLEAQGNAYDYTTHIATLSGQQSYLGWGNHVGLLTGNYDEVRRREQLTEQWYKESDCSKRNQLLKDERITHAVLGPLEKQKYGATDPSSIACLIRLFAAGEYIVVAPSS